MMHWKPNLRDKRGFTVMEAVFSIAILSMLGTVVAAMVVRSVGTWSSGISRSNAENAADIAAQKLAQEICIGSSATKYYNQLIVNVPTLVKDSYGESYYSSAAGTTAYRYRLENDKLYREVNGGRQLMARDITAIDFIVEGNLVSYTVTGKRTDGTATSLQQSKGSIVMRNFGH